MNKLEKFGAEIIKTCLDLGVVPIVYGSYAVKHSTKSKTLKVGDIDFYVSEKYFKKIVERLNILNIKHEYSEKWHTLPILKGKLKVELDSLDFWYKGTRNFDKYNFYGLDIKILTLNDLKIMYKYASEKSDSPEKNLKKYKMLDKIK